MITKLLKIQNELKAPKGQLNKFGGYAYRSAEDILEAVKPLLLKYGLTMTISDELECIGERYYVKATVYVQDTERAISTTAFAREDESQKGMSVSQITGSASSYARKYALNGMFAIDDTKDADSYNDHGKSEPKVKEVKKATTKQIDELVELLSTEELMKAKSFFIKKGIPTLEEGDFDTIQKMIDKKNVKV